MKNKKYKRKPLSETDLAPHRICQFDELRITGLDRVKVNQIPEKDCSSMLAVAGSRFSCVVTTRSRFPIKSLSMEVEGEIPCKVSPVESVVFPEEATLVPDLLSEKCFIDVAGNTTAIFLLIFKLPQKIECRDYRFVITANSTSHRIRRKEFTLNIIPAPEPKHISKPKVTFWPHWKRFAMYLNVELWSEEFWRLAEIYLKEMAAGGMNVIMASINHDPFCYPLPEEYYEYNYYPPMVVWERDTDGEFIFDFSVYDRYVELNLRLGIDKEIECHSLLPCKQQEPKIYYHDIASGELKTIETISGSPVYKKAWTAFLKAFIAHNRKRGWQNLLTICPYDEPSDPKRFSEVAEFAKKLAPEVKISAAVTSRVALELIGCIDISTIHLEVGFDKEAVKELRKNGVELRWYNCCAPDWGNTLFSCDLAEAYRISWITEYGKYKGFLRWAIIGWPESWDKNPGFNWPTGDTYLIAPGINGPIETLRWHAYRQGCQDLRLLLQLEDTPEVQCLLSYIGKNHPLETKLSPGEFQQKVYRLMQEQQTVQARKYRKEYNNQTTKNNKHRECCINV